MLDTVDEPKAVSEMFMKQAKRLAEKSKKKQHNDEDDNGFEELENAYTELHFGKQNREMEHMAQNLINNVKKEEIEAEEKDDEEDNGSSSEDEKNPQPNMNRLT